jgi:hypothetical protein
MKRFTANFAKISANVCGLILFLLIFISNKPILSKGYHINDNLTAVRKYLTTLEDFIKSYIGKFIKIGLTNNINIREKYLSNLLNKELSVAKK